MKDYNVVQEVLLQVSLCHSSIIRYAILLSPIWQSIFVLFSSLCVLFCRSTSRTSIWQMGNVIQWTNYLSPPPPPFPPPPLPPLPPPPFPPPPPSPPPLSLPP